MALRVMSNILDDMREIASEKQDKSQNSGAITNTSNSPTHNSNTTTPSSSTPPEGCRQLSNTDFQTLLQTMEKLSSSFEQVAAESKVLAVASLARELGLTIHIVSIPQENGKGIVAGLSHLDASWLLMGQFLCSRCALHSSRGEQHASEIRFSLGASFLELW